MFSRCLTAPLSLLMVCAFIFKPLQDTKSTKPPAEAKCENIINTENWRQKKYVIWVLTIPFTLLGYFVPYVHAVSTAFSEFISNRDYLKSIGGVDALLVTA